MKAKYTKYGSNLAFLDFLFNCFLSTMFLFLMALLLVQPPTKKLDGIQMKAEYIITLSWPNGSMDDVDLWLKVPDGRYVFFRNRDINIAMLDRDDLGGISNIYVNSKGEKKLIDYHQEIITIRAIVPGTYVVNTHVYRVNKSFAGVDSATNLPYPITITLTKVNPRVVEVASRTITMTRWNEEQTAFSFEVLEDGEIGTIDQNTQYEYINRVVAETAPRIPIEHDVPINPETTR